MSDEILDNEIVNGTSETAASVDSVSDATPVEEAKPAVVPEAVAEVKLSALTEALCKKISESSPCGDDPKYSNEFEVVKVEIAKPGARDFELIAQKCNTILTAQSKDITAFVYYILAAGMTTGADDLCSIIVAFSKVTCENWDTIHPLRERARMNSLSWLNEERTIGLLSKMEVTSAHHKQLLLAKDALDAIKNLTFQKFPDSPPSIKGITQLVEGWIKKTKSAEATPASGKSSSSSSRSSSPSSQSGGQTGAAQVASTGAPMQDLGSKSDAQKNMQKIALFLLQSEPDNSLGYKLLRMVKWQELSAEPKVEAGKTVFAAPLAQRVSHYQSLSQQQNWDAILDKSETIFTEPGLHFWFDLQHYVCQALTAKGGKYLQCADAIKGELAALLRRVPTLKDLKFKDETPFATTQTKEWLEEIVAQQSGGGGAPTHFSVVKAQDLETDLVTAEELLGKGKFDEALHLIQSGCAYGSLKEICERKCVMARMCYQNKQYHIADSLLSELDDQIISRKLDEWDKNFCIEVWTLHIKVLSIILETATIVDADKELFKLRLRGTYKRLSNSNPLSALKLNFI